MLPEFEVTSVMMTLIRRNFANANFARLEGSARP